MFENKRFLLFEREKSETCLAIFAEKQTSYLYKSKKLLSEYFCLKNT